MKEQTDPNVPVTGERLRKRLRIHTQRTTLVAASTLIGTVIGGYSYMLDKSAEAAEKAVSPLTEQITAIWSEVHRFEEVTNASTAAQNATLVEIQKDIRALYRTQQTGTREPRLEVEPKPIDAGIKPDGGTR